MDANKNKSRYAVLELPTSTVLRRFQPAPFFRVKKGVFLFGYETNIFWLLWGAGLTAGFAAVKPVPLAPWQIVLVQSQQQLEGAERALIGLACDKACCAVRGQLHADGQVAGDRLAGDGINTRAVAVKRHLAAIAGGIEQAILLLAAIIFLFTAEPLIK